MIDEAHDNSKPVPVDSGTQQLAAVYAKALLGAAEAKGVSSTVVEELDALAQLLRQQPRFGSVLATQLLGDDERQGIIDRVFAPRFSGLVVDFLRVLSKHGRMELLLAIEQEFHRLHDELRGMIQVRISTATPLDSSSTDKITKSLRVLLAGEPRLETSVDPDLIGGAVFRVGDTIYDGSIASQLAQLRTQIINRSVHEIQSRRDRFRNPSGN